MIVYEGRPLTRRRFWNEEWCNAALRFELVGRRLTHVVLFVRVDELPIALASLISLTAGLSG